jgi:hypothetical protein
MAMYCFSTPDGLTTVEREFDRDGVPEFVRVGGKRAYRDRQAEGVGGFVATGQCGRSGHGIWPMSPCVASGVHASQAQELRDHLADRGCPTEVTPGGDPIYTSAAHRKRALKARGLHDRNSFS